MEKKEKWQPTKFILNENGRIIASKDYVGKSSILAVNKAGILYQRYLEKYSKGIFLDLGCGTVPLFSVYRNQVDEVICIDWDNSLHKNIHLDYTTDLNKKIPLPENSVQTVLLSDVLEHIYNPKILMSEISRVLKEDGKLILGVPFFYRLHEKPYDFHRYTSYELKKLCKSNDLSVIEMEEWGGAISIIFDIIGKCLPSWLSPYYFQKIIIWISKRKIVKSIDNKTKANFPLGYCLVAQKNYNS